MNNQERIERYIRGRLSAEEIDQLSIEFLRAPVWNEYFLTELHLMAIFRSKRREKATLFHHSFTTLK